MAMEEAQQELERKEVVVGIWPSLQAACERALVILAMRRSCWVEEERPGSFALHAEPEDELAIRQELELYEDEESQRIEPVELPVFPPGFAWFSVWLAALVSVFIWQLNDPAVTGRFSNSSLGMIDQHEWWRPFTALFLHGGVGHLLGNLCIGGVFCVMVAQTLGAWRGWPLILLAGTLGNALNAWLRYPAAFQSIGASTMTFAALGVLVGVAAFRSWRGRSFLQLRPLMVPVMVGLIMLGWFGISGENTDIGGHFAGWSCGVIGGFATGRWIRS
ncbi:rhomboid family intramembrane serine protease [Luteolibacter pohnpeiensis]|uniref:Rhomboid family intramembrane serine protease n=1 Tax=Luteolibacter pohnpeiensis TaxID=454153 RepID=A0A934VT20_9BACT|nr:rhomboid family intramembrane serine protease [Luteolibacter pohnpeiensis]MBK1881032.1 rhomboid family intramembrane serine protease [Luteolibacter pohnpeiensis]